MRQSISPAGTPHGLPSPGSFRLLLIFLLVVFAVGSLGALFPPGAWYQTLDKPPWTPPDAVFAPTWIVLYVLVAIAGWLIFTHAPGKAPRLLWALQLALNAAWSWLFFGEYLIGWALLDVLLVSAMTFVLIVHLLRNVFTWSRLAAIVLMPYWAWVTFAAALNASIFLRAAAG